MNRALAGLLVGLTGCYPLIPGPWSDYDTPRDTRIVGEMYWSEFVGGYWDENVVDGGGAYWGLLDAAQTDRSANDLIFNGEFGCRNGAADISWFTDATADLDDEESTIEGADNAYQLDWAPDVRVFVDDFDEEPEGIYALSSFDSGEGAFSVSGFVEVVEPLFFDASLIDGDTLQTKVARELSFTWEARQTDYANVVAVLYDQADVEVERVTCVIPASDGTIDIDKDLWENLEDGSYWVVYLGVAHESVGRIEGAPPGTGSRMLYSRSIVGAISKKN